MAINITSLEALEKFLVVGWDGMGWDGRKGALLRALLVLITLTSVSKTFISYLRDPHNLLELLDLFGLHGLQDLIYLT